MPITPITGSLFHADSHALRHAIQKYAGRSHAEGNYGRFACVDWRTWATSAR
jgi:hypothetical protein